MGGSDGKDNSDHVFGVLVIFAANRGVEKCVYIYTRDIRPFLFVSNTNGFLSFKNPFPLPRLILHR